MSYVFSHYCCCFLINIYLGGNSHLCQFRLNSNQITFIHRLILPFFIAVSNHLNYSCRVYSSVLCFDGYYCCYDVMSTVKDGGWFSLISLICGTGHRVRSCVLPRRYAIPYQRKSVTNDDMAEIYLQVE